MVGGPQDRFENHCTRPHLQKKKNCVYVSFGHELNDHKSFKTKRNQEVINMRGKKSSKLMGGVRSKNKFKNNVRDILLQYLQFTVLQSST